MTDEKKPSQPNDDEFDWDSALSEWEKGSFEPEVAKDKETQRPAVLESTSGTPAAPIYKPPPLRIPNIQAPGAPLPTKELPSAAAKDNDPTKIGTIPKVLRQGAPKPPALPPRPGHGGLGQLFGKPEGEAKAPPIPPPVPQVAPKPKPSAPQVAKGAISPNLPPPRKEQPTLSTETDDALLDAMLDDKAGPPSEHPSIVTSADLPKLSSLLPEEPLKRPPATAEDPVPEGALFDPFEDPESKRAAKRDATPTAPPPPASRPKVQAQSTAPVENRNEAPTIVPRPAPSAPRMAPRPPVRPAAGVPATGARPLAPTPAASSPSVGKQQTANPLPVPKDSSTKDLAKEAAKENVAPPATPSSPLSGPDFFDSLVSKPDLSEEPTPAPPLLIPEQRVHDPDGVTSTIDVKSLDLSAALDQIDKLDAFETTTTIEHDEDEGGQLEVVGEADADSDVHAEAQESYVSQSEADEYERLEDLPRLNTDDAPSDEEGEEEEATQARARPSLASLPPAPTMAPIEAERPATEWLEDEHARNVVEHRAAWLEEEARSLDDKDARARGLLIVSEMRAMLGQREAALALASEAREMSPPLALAHRQVRGLFETRDAKQLSEAIATSAKNATTPAATLHETLFAADVARVAGDEAALQRFIDEAVRVAPTDIRVTTLRAGLALSKNELASPALRIETEVSEPLAHAASDALAIRGATGALPPSPAALPIQAMRRARAAVARGDVTAASEALGELVVVPDLEASATWIASIFAANDASTRARATVALRKLATAEDEHEGADTIGAARALAAVGLQSADSETVHAALEHSTAFSNEERLMLRLLIADDAELVRNEIDAVAASGEEPSALLAAASSFSSSGEEHHAGNDASKRAVLLGHLLGHARDFAPIEAAVDARAEDAPGEMKMLKLDIARRQARWADVSSALSEWGQESLLDRGLASALVAERAGNKELAATGYRSAYAAFTASDVALRPLASLDPKVDLAVELAAISDALGVSPKGAITRIEATLRAANLDDATKKERLDRAHEAAPTLPIASFLAERYARRLGSIDDVLRYVRARRAASNDPIEGALDAIREALLVVDSDPSLAASRLEEAHHARPDDFALRELFERLSVSPVTDRGTWREQRADKAPDETKALLLLEAAYDYERLGDATSALRAATAAKAAARIGIESIVAGRAEIRTGQVARLADELLTRARGAENEPTARREAYERLSEIDAVARNDMASALLWHRTILEDFPSHKPSLRYVEHALISEGRDDELEPIAQHIARALSGAPGGESSAHANLSARLKMRAGDWDGTAEMAELARSQPEKALWALRLVNAHARATNDNIADLETTLALLERSNRPVELVTLLLRGADAAVRVGKIELAKDLLERASASDPGDIVVWEKLARVRRQLFDASGSAEAFESVARTSLVRAHQLEGWYQAGIIWLDTVKDVGRGITALEQIINVDVNFRDVFPRLSALYAQRGNRTELASLLERRVGSVNDPSERIGLEIERGRVLAEAGDVAGARQAFEVALEREPDNTAALTAYAELCARMSDWNAAEQAWVRLARSLTTPEEQRAVYSKLGELYLTHAVNLSRAETAFKEVLKRAPDDIPATEKLIDVFKRANDAAHAIELQQQLITRATDPNERRRRLIELSQIYEATSHDQRKAEQALETARREYPTDVIVLRALAEFYTRHRQMPAVHILLDRAAAEARRSFAAGRFMPPLFEVMAAVYDIRGKKDAARAVQATLAALNGQSANVQGAEARAGDPRLDEVLAPEVLTPALRALLARTGDALDGVFPLDPRAVRAVPLPSNAGPVYNVAQTIASGMQIPALQIFVSPQIGPTCIPVGSAPPTIVIGEQLLNAPNPLARTFLIVRALKLVQAHASALLRVPSNDLPVLIAGWLQVFNPSWVPQGLNPQALAEAVRRIQAVLPRRNDADVGLIALEVAGSLGNQASALGPGALAWADRTGLLAVGDMSAALDGIAWVMGMPNGAPKGPAERGAWIARTPEAKELFVYSVSDSYAEARMRAGLR
jgi:tetratricopeptide (TPR) repeat protein